jgi:hypothetical protein
MQAPFWNAWNDSRAAIDRVSAAAALVFPYETAAPAIGMLIAKTRRAT